MFERQAIEDGDLTTQVWAPDRSLVHEGEEDPDNDDYLLIPRAKPIHKGKQPDHTPFYDISNDEEDDCRILDPIDAIPISWSPSCVRVKTDAATTSRKRAGESGSDAPPPKKPKQVTDKPIRLKNMPTTKG